MNRFSQANTWLLIALLALAGWTVDALRMFLGMHETFWAGLVAFASHFWYAVPMAVAIIVLTRLQPQARLLGLAAYDETGRLVHHQGEFQPEELTVKGILAALRGNGQHGLHGLTLPSGACVYFVRQGGLTLIASFSRPAPPQACTERSRSELAASVQKLRAEVPAAFDLLDGLEPSVAALAANVVASPVTRNVLSFLYQHGRTAMQAADLAYWAEADEGEVGQALEGLAELSLVQPLCVCDLTFYQLNRDRDVLARLDKLFAWQRKWQSQLQRLEQMIG